ncbi:MAG: HD-GYP domain-containing protein, partial [bacterium]
EPIFLILLIPAVFLFLYGVSLPMGGEEEVPVFPLVTAAIIFYGPAAGAWLDSFSFFLSVFLHPKRRRALLSKDFKQSFQSLTFLLLNMGSFTYSGGITGLAWVQMSHYSPPSQSYLHIGALFAMGIIYLLLNTFSVTLAGAIWEGKPFSQVWLTNYSWSAVLVFIEVGLGVLYVLIYFLGGIPLLLIGFSFLAVLRLGYLVHLERARILNLFTELLHEQLARLDYPTKRHCDMVARLAEAVGKAVGIPFWRREQLSYAAKLHDVGKIAIDERIIHNPQPLTPKEREEIRRHTSVVYQAMREVPFLRQVGYWILLHHEKEDGSGYWGRRGDEVPIEAKILGIVDAIHALTSPRPYRPERPSYTLYEAMNLLFAEAEKGKWDIKLLNIVKAILQEDETLRGMLNEG